MIEHPRLVFFIGFFVFCIGIGCGIMTDMWQGIWFALAYTLLVVLLAGWRKWYTILLLISLVLIGHSLGKSTWEKRYADWKILQSQTQNFSGTYQITGRVDRIMYTSDLTSTYRLHIDKIDSRSTSTGKVLSMDSVGIFLEIPKNLHISVGDTISYQGKIQSIINFPLRGFAGYAWYHRIYGKSTVPIFERIVLHENGIFDKMQSWSKATLFKGFPENIAGIILGMTIGNIELLSNETKKYFTNAGITHILVVSGSNIAFLIVILSGILRYFPLYNSIRSVIIITFVILYGTLVGWDMPVIRAVTMGLIVYISLEGGKIVSSISLLILVGWSILIYSPLALIYDAGFGLSFGGTLGILLFHGKIGNLIKNKYTPRWIIDIFSVTIAASVGSITAIIYHFGVIPLYTVIANILISGVLGWILFSSVVYLLVVQIGNWAAYLWGWTVYIPTTYIMHIGKWFGDGYTYTIDTVWAEPLSLFLIGCMIAVFISLEYNHLLESKKVHIN